MKQIVKLLESMQASLKRLEQENTALHRKIDRGFGEVRADIAAVERKLDVTIRDSSHEIRSLVVRAGQTDGRLEALEEKTRQ